MFSPLYTSNKYRELLLYLHATGHSWFDLAGHTVGATRVITQAKRMPNVKATRAIIQKSSGRSEKAYPKSSPLATLDDTAAKSLAQGGTRLEALGFQRSDRGSHLASVAFI
jgi:hypothetical protein